MKKTALMIRQELAKSGVTPRMVSVRCFPSYQIRVDIKDKTLDGIFIERVVKRCYYAKTHHWLCCWVDGKMLPLASAIEQPAQVLSR